jgi:D-alanyl-D-alanine carboxypeptidase
MSGIQMLVSESHPLPDDYLPESLISLYSLNNRFFYMPPVRMSLVREAAEALNDMCRAAKEEGNYDCVISGAYRTRMQQEKKYINDLSKSTARPGCSEHETGLAADIISADPRQKYKLHGYLQENGYRFGYIYRYPRGREMITGVVEKPQHFRYVGTEAARRMKVEGLTLEEYLDPSIVRPDPYDPAYILMSIFGPKMKGHWQSWPEIDLNELRKVNPDTVGWIHMDQTPIDYPILCHRESPGYYLNHNFSDEPSAHGGIELYGRPESGIIVLVGHHMKDASMFMKLIEISDRRTFDVHPDISLNYKGTVYRACWFAVQEMEAMDMLGLPEPDDKESRAAWLKRLKEESFLSNDVVADPDDKILICITCTRALDSVLVLYGVMREK